METKKTQEVQSPIYTTDEAAQFLRVTKVTLENWRKAGKGPAWLQPNGPWGRVLYLKDALDAYLGINGASQQ
jgi:hypothetical protein